MEIFGTTLRAKPPEMIQFLATIKLVVAPDGLVLSNFFAGVHVHHEVSLLLVRINIIGMGCDMVEVCR